MKKGFRRRLVLCCTRTRDNISIDFDANANANVHHSRIITYDGLETCILNSQFYVNATASTGESVHLTESFEEKQTSCSSSKDASASFYSDWTAKRDDEGTHEWCTRKPESPKLFFSREAYATQFSDVEGMKEKFSKLLLGEDVTGGPHGKTSALSISNAITNLAASVFGELWKLEPLQEEGKAKWIKEMNWLLTPANYMVELVPSKQSGTNGRTFEIMMPKARADVHMNIPALQKIDSMLIGVLDSMMGSEFWYTEGNSRKEGGGVRARHNKRWWLPYPRVSAGGLSENARNKLISQGNMVHQVFKAAKSINENVLLEMTVPKAIQDTLPKSGKANLGEELYKVISSGSRSTLDMLDCLKLRSEHEVLDTINKLEAASLVWKERIKELVDNNTSTLRSYWSFGKEQPSEIDKIQSILLRLDALLYQLKTRHPCLPHTFLDVTKIQYGQDIGHAILEAYSRVLGNLAFSILSRIGDILQEDYLSNPNSPISTCSYDSGLILNRMLDSPVTDSGTRQSLLNQMNKVDGYFSDSVPSRFSDSEISSSIETKFSSVSETPSSSSIWCIDYEENGKPSLDKSLVYE